MTKTIICPSCKEELELPIKKCPTCGYKFNFKELQPVIPTEVVEPIEAVVPVEVVEPIEAVVPLDYNPNEKEKVIEEVEETQEIPTVAIFDENTPAFEPPQPKERKRIKVPTDYKLINHEKRLSFALIFTIILSVPYIVISDLPIYTIINNTLLQDLYLDPVIYDIAGLLNYCFRLLTIGYFILIAALSIAESKTKRKTAIALNIISIVMQFAFMIALQFVVLKAGIANYVILVFQIIWCAIQITLLNIKREG